MSASPLITFVALCALLTAGLALALRRRRSARLLRLGRDRAAAEHAAATRLLRLAADDMRGRALSLLGWAGRDDAAAPIAAAAAGFLRLADDLHDHAVPDGATRVLLEEPVAIGALLDDAIAALTTTLAPGRRQWRVQPELSAVVLRADRRALAQVIARVLANAARFTRDDDWIDMILERSHDAIRLVVMDEGAGVMAPRVAAEPGAPESRGIGLGLSLARALMEAHGGTLSVQSAARVGTRVTLAFPSSREPVAPQRTG